LLKFRLRSEQEIYQRLKRKEFEEDIIRDTLGFLKNKGFIDDTVFTKSWIQSRLKKPLGLRRIKQELKLKGIDKEIVDLQINEIKESYCEQDLVFRLAESRLSKLKSVDPAAARRRVYAYLIRRGFSPEIVIDCLSQLKDQS